MKINIFSALILSLSLQFSNSVQAETESNSTRHATPVHSQEPSLLRPACDDTLMDSNGLSLDARVNRYAHALNSRIPIDRLIPNARNRARRNIQLDNELENGSLGWMTTLEHLERMYGVRFKSETRNNEATSELLARFGCTTQSLVEWRRYFFWLNQLPEEILADLVKLVDRPNRYRNVTRSLDLLLQTKTAFGSIPELIGYGRKDYEPKLILELFEIGDRLADYGSKQIDNEGLEHINRWVKSSNHAIVLYRYLLALHSNVRKYVLLSLIRNNVFFKGAQMTHGEPYILITRAFEKETTNPALALMYLPKGESFSDWLNKTPDDLRERLKRAKSALPSDFFIPRLSGIRFDGSTKTAFYEVKSADFEVTADSLFESLNALLKLLNETREIHEHIVFPLPEHPSEDFVLQFTLWFKYINDILYWVGMTDKKPMAPTKMTALVTGAEMLHGPNGWTNNKFHSGGFRTSIFEDKSRKMDGWVLTSIELRDITGEPERWRAIDTNLSKSILSRAWIDPYSGPLLSMNVDPQISNLVFPEGAHFTETEIKFLSKFNLAVSFPFQAIEKMNWGGFNPKTARPLAANQLKDLNMARKYYAKEIRDLLNELKRLEDQKPTEEKGSWSEEDQSAIETAINISIAEFAAFAGLRNWLPF